MTEKNSKKKTYLTISLNVLYAKNEKYILCTFQNITQNLKTNYSINDFV